jgi:hypothetical protein
MAVLSCARASGARRRINPAVKAAGRVEERFMGLEVSVGFIV